MAESFNHFGQISEALDLAISQIPRKAAFDIQAKYASTAPRDTSFMANSAYVVTSQESTYGQGGTTSSKGGYLLPEVERPDDKYTAYLAIGANYAVYVELGTVHMAAQPAFYPAVDAVRPSFDAAVEAVKAKIESTS